MLNAVVYGLPHSESEVYYGKLSTIGPAPTASWLLVPDPFFKTLIAVSREIHFSLNTP